MSFPARVLRAIRRRLPQRQPRPLFRRGTDESIAVPFGYAAHADVGRVAVVIHLFYDDMASYFRRLCSHIPGRSDLFITTPTADKRDRIAAAFAGWPGGTVTIRLQPNRGRDMTAKFVTFRDAVADHDLVLFLHSKKSLYFEDGGDWLDALTRGLAGSRAVIESVFALFGQDDRLGVVFPQHFDGIRDRLSWGGNRPSAGRLAARFGLSLRRARSFDFVSGSMFWARPAALRPLWSLGLSLEDFDAEAGQLDATTAHALERLILYACEHAGYHWVKVADKSLYRDARSVIEVRSPEALPEVMRRVRHDLL